MLEDDAPRDLVIGPGEQLFFTAAVFAVAVAVTVHLFRRQPAAEIKLRLLVLVSGTLCVVYEPLAEYLGGYWNATIGQWKLYSQYGHQIPVWHLPMYYIFLGGFAFIVFDRSRRGCTAASLWRLYAVFFLVDCAIELPSVTLTTLSRYYGQQPYYSAEWFPLPLWYPAINGMWPIAMAAAIALVVRLGQLWLMPFIMVATAFAAYASTAWPVWAALNAQVSMPITYLAGTVTIGLSLVLAHTMILALTRLNAVVGSSGHRADLTEVR